MGVRRLEQPCECKLISTVMERLQIPSGLYSEKKSRDIIYKAGSRPKGRVQIHLDFAKLVPSAFLPLLPANIQGRVWKPDQTNPVACRPRSSPHGSASRSPLSGFRMTLEGDKLLCRLFPSRYYSTNVIPNLRPKFKRILLPPYFSFVEIGRAGEGPTPSPLTKKGAFGNAPFLRRLYLGRYRWKPDLPEQCHSESRPAYKS